MRSIDYSNNFSVYYAYDAGGQVKGVVGYYGNYRTDYVKDIQYDEYGSRTKVEYGNGVVSTYAYDALMHRLMKLQTKQGDSILQNIAYSYDRVGNILTRTENGIKMSDRTPKTITHRYSYDSLYRLVEAEGTIKENGTEVQSYSNAFTYNDIGNIMKKLQTVKVQGENDPLLTYNYTYSYTTNKPHAVTGINDNLTYRYDANGNMTAVYDTAKNYNRVLYWDDDNRLTKTVDTQAGVSTATQYAYDAKGMRIIKDGPYGKSIYVDTGYVLSQEYIESNHVFVGNTRIASVVKHKDETKPATYYYATDHLGSSSVLTTSTGGYHERIEYLPYGEVWLEDSAQSSGYTTPYKFTGKELDKETGLYYFGARYYDARISRWVSTDPALEKYIAKPNDFDTEHDLYWYILNDASGKLPGMGGVYNAINLDMYHYAGNNPIKLTDPNGNQTVDPEIFKQMIMSDPLIQLIKGIFEGDEGAKYAVKMGTIEVGIKAGEGLNNIGTGVIIFGVMDGNPAMVVVGGAIDKAGDITKLSFMIIKAVDTKSANDINAAMEEGIEFASSELLSKIAKSTVENSCAKKYYSDFIKTIFGESSKLKEIDKKAGEQILSKMVAESNKFIINMVFKKENE